MKVIRLEDFLLAKKAREGDFKSGLKLTQAFQNTQDQDGMPHLRLDIFLEVIKHLGKWRKAGENTFELLFQIGLTHLERGYSFLAYGYFLRAAEEIVHVYQREDWDNVVESYELESWLEQTNITFT